jgi:L-fuconolactonase
MGPLVVGRVHAHHHVWDLGARDQRRTEGLAPLRRSFSLDDLRPYLAAAGIERTVVVQTVCVAEDTPELLALAEEAPEVAGVVGWVDLCSLRAADALASLREGPGGPWLVGARHQVQEEPDPGWLSRSDVRRGLVTVGEAGLAYDFVVKHHQLPAVIDTVAAHGDVSFVLDHAGKPPIVSGGLAPWREHIGALGRLRNVAVKLSGLVTEADHANWRTDDLRPYVEAALESFGPERAM